MANKQTRSKGLKKARNIKKDSKTKNRQKNLEEGTNPITGKTFFILEKAAFPDHYVMFDKTFQTREGAEAFKKTLSSRGYVIYEKANLVKALYKKTSNVKDPHVQNKLVRRLYKDITGEKLID